MKKYLVISAFLFVCLLSFSAIKHSTNVAFAAPGVPECSDGSDNDGDSAIDDFDPDCHLDGNPSNPASYDSSIWQEAGAGLPCPTCTVNGGGGGGGGGNGGGGGGGNHLCIDTLDNDSDGLIDAKDPGCHTDGDPTNPNSYNPVDDNEVNVVSAPLPTPQVLGATATACGLETGRPCLLQRTGGVTPNVAVDPRLAPNRKANKIAQEEGNSLIIPKLGINKPILQLQNSSVLFREAWILPWTSTPDKGGNTVLVGHAYYYRAGSPYTKSTFYDLDKMKVGDEIEINWKGKKYTYVVSESKKVSPDQIEIENQTTTPTLTIYSCGKFTNTVRTVVVATLKV